MKELGYNTSHENIIVTGRNKLEMGMIKNWEKEYNDLYDVWRESDNHSDQSTLGMLIFSLHSNPASRLPSFQWPYPCKLCHCFDLLWGSGPLRFSV